MPSPVSRPRPVPRRRQNVRPSVRPRCGRSVARRVSARTACPGRSRTRWNDATLVPGIAGHARRGPGDRGNRTGRGPHGRGRLPAGLGAGGRAGRPGHGAWTSGRSGIATPATGTRRRLLGRRAAVPVFVGDVAKGALAALVGLLLGGPWWVGYVGVAAAMVGHAWPVFAGFRGGRSVLTFVGGMLVLAPVPALIAAAVCAVITLVTRRFAIGARVAVFGFPRDPGPVRAPGARRRHGRAHVHHRPALRHGGLRRAPRRRRRHRSRVGAAPPGPPRTDGTPQHAEHRGGIGQGRQPVRQVPPLVGPGGPGQRAAPAGPAARGRGRRPGAAAAGAAGGPGSPAA